MKMEDRKVKKIHTLTLAFGIAFMPPIWAVVSPYIGVSTGAVALICAGLYVANGNKRADAFRITIGFLLGDLWAFLAVNVMAVLPFHPNVELYCTLFVLGALAVMIGETWNKVIFLPSWLCGWAIGLTIMGPMTTAEIGTVPMQIAASMIAGVLYVGIGVDLLQRFLINIFVKTGEENV